MNVNKLKLEEVMGKIEEKKKNVTPFSDPKSNSPASTFLLTFWFEVFKDLFVMYMLDTMSKLRPIQ